MSDYSGKQSRADNRAKATRLTRADPHQKVDASDWTPPEAMNASAQTGARPVRSRIYKHGGKVQGDRGPRRADRVPRASGGSVVKDYVNRDVPAANAEFGKPHTGGFKKGGSTVAEGVHKHEKHMHKGEKLTEMCAGGAMKSGGRTARKSGGRAKGKTNINIVIGQPAQHAQPVPVPQAPVRPPVMPAPPPAPPPGAMAGALPMPPPGAPMMRKDGGRTKPLVHMDAGSGSGLGRLEKMKRYGANSGI